MRAIIIVLICLVVSLVYAANQATTIQTSGDDFICGGELLSDFSPRSGIHVDPETCRISKSGKRLRCSLDCKQGFTQTGTGSNTRIICKKGQDWQLLRSSRLSCELTDLSVILCGATSLEEAFELQGYETATLTNQCEYRGNGRYSCQDITCPDGSEAETAPFQQDMVVKCRNMEWVFPSRRPECQQDCPTMPIAAAALDGDQVSFTFTVASGNTVKCVAAEDSRSDQSIIEDATAFWAFEGPNVSWSEDAWVSAVSTGASQTITTPNDLDGTYYHKCSARGVGSNAACPLVATNPPSTYPCFPGWSLVTLANGDKVEIRDLKVGDEVLCMVEGQGFSTCTTTTFINVQSDYPQDFVVLHYVDKDGNDASISATKSHYLVRANEDVSESTSTPEFDYVRASEFQVGDRLVRHDADSNSVDTVVITDVTSEQEPEYYSPMMNNGATLFVENIFVSSLLGRRDPRDAYWEKAPMWQKLEDREGLTVGTPGHEFPNGLHPYFYLSSEVRKKFKPINTVDFTAEIKRRIANGHIFSQQEMLNLIVAFSEK